MSAPTSPAATPTPAPKSAPGIPSPDTFPPDFRWGCASSAFQVEGAAETDGRAPSIWDTYCRRPGNILMDHDGMVATDFYHRYPEDIAFMKWLGIDMFRFSVAWPRVLPQGRGAVNSKGLEFYDRLVDALLAAGIEPWVTLFHWDLPEALEKDYGGWTSPEIPKFFADYAARVTERLSDRVKHFFTVNEFSCFIDGGYFHDRPYGSFAPGRVVSRRTFNQARHHALLAHGLAVQALRAAGRNLRVGLADNPRPTLPIVGTAPHVDAARRAFRELNAPFFTPLFEGRYLDSYLATEGADAPRFTDDEMRLIGAPLDFVGVNLYNPTHVRATAAAPGWEIVPQPAAYPRMNLDWFFIDPDILYWIPRYLKELWGVSSVYISENGCAATDQIERTGEIRDTDRIFFLRHHLRGAARAVAEGWPLKGYFHWSLSDSFEWSYGYTKRFGLQYVDYQTLQRTKKLSAHYFRDVIASRRIS